MPLHDDQDPMPPVVVTVSDPVVTGVVPVPDDPEPFMLKRRSNEELIDYDAGFKCGESGGPNDDTKSSAWQQGWAEAQE